jgi:hypothetical protein
MSRKTAIVTVPSWGGRDDGRTFLITEKSALQIEKWSWRMFIAVKGTSAHVDEAIARLGAIGVAIRGLNSFLAADVKFSDIDPLLDELLTCVQMIRDPRRPDVTTPLIIDTDIEEPRTLLWLRSEVLSLHLGFSVADALSALLTWLNQNSQDSPST